MSISNCYLLRITLSCFIVISAVVLLSGQNTLYTKIDKSDGLPSNFTYRVLEDMEGYIWICSDSGVCKYDGQKMKCFDQTDGLPDKDIYKITLDELGRLWLIHASNKIAFIQNDSVHVFPTTAKPNFQYQYLNHGPNQGMRIDDQPFIINGKNQIKAADLKYTSNSSNDLLWHNFFLVSTPTEVIVKTLDGKKINSLFRREKGLHVVSQYHQPTKTFQLYTDNKLYIYDTLFVKQEIVDLERPNDIFILSALKDKWGNIWVCTREGVFFQNFYQRIHNISLDQNTLGTNILQTLNYRDLPIIIDNRGKVYIYKSNKLILISEIDNKSGNTYQAKIVENYLYISYGIVGFVRINLNPSSNYRVEKLNNLTKKYVIANDSIAFAAGRKFQKIELDNNKFLDISSDIYKNISFDRSDNTIWTSTNDSLYIYKYESEINLKSVRSFPLIQNLKYLGSGKTMITTYDSKNYLCTKDTCNQILSNNPIHIKSLKNLYGTVWLNTTTGLYRSISTIDQASKNLNFELYFNYSSLQKDIIVNDIVSSNGVLFLGTESGLITIDNLEEKGMKTSIPISINTVNDKKIHTNIIALNYDENNLKIEYSARYFGNQSQLRYDYILEGSQRDTLTTTDNILRFNDLSHGDYVFKIRATDSFGSSSSFVEAFIEIRKAWYHRSSVYIIAFLFLCGLVYLLFRIYISRVNNRNELQQQFAELELSALQSQMNPHFVFNAMNSIQNLITDNKLQEADLYVTKLANLMRKYLESSKEKYISIEEELQIVETYLELEQLRFGDKIVYHIDNKLEDGFLFKMIPATIVQPFVENALKHGLFHKKGGGNIYIRLYNELNVIFIEIEDDGVGRARVKEIQAKNKRQHKSTGTKSIEKKLEALRKLDKVKIDFSVEDLFSKEGPNGTKVIIRIIKY